MIKKESDELRVTPFDIKTEWKNTKELREIVNAWANRTGYQVSELVSRYAEHDLEKKYGKMLLEEDK